MPLETPKEDGARTDRQSVKSDGLVEKTVEGERNQNEDPAPSNSGPSCSRRGVSPVSSSSVSDIKIAPGAGTIQLHEEELEQIFGFLTFTEVKSARLVSKAWREVATMSLRRSSKEIEMNLSVSECITKMDAEQFPVNRLLVRLFADEYYGIGNTEIGLASLPEICAWVKELTLSVNIKKLVMDDMATFPTGCIYKDLTHFNLRLYQWTNLFRESWERVTDFVRSILENSPNLREVTVEYYFGGVNGAERFAICPVIENLFPISSSVETSKLNYIKFKDVPLEKIDWAKWSTLNLKLRKLWLNISCFSNTNNLLAEFLETQSQTLKYLTLNLGDRDTEAPPATFIFPRLEKLEQLQVISAYTYAPGTFADIDYARMFPCLKKLDLKYDDGNWRDFLGNDLLQPTNTVEELIFPQLLQPDGNLTPNPAVIAARVFTGLKKLEIYPDRHFTEAVYENMPNLEVLIFSNRSSYTYDDIITGLSLDVCRKFRGVMTRRWIKKLNSGLQNAEGRSMARLQNLKTLRLRNCVFADRLHFSRLSLHVFKKMSSLQCLDLFGGCAVHYPHYEGLKQLLMELESNFVLK